MVVEVSRLTQLLDPVVQTFDACFSRLGSSDSAKEICFSIHALTQGVEILEVVEPDSWSHLQPSLPIGAPADLLQELFRRLVGVPLQDRASDLLLGEESMADIGRERRNRAGYVVTALGIVSSRKGYKPTQTS
jgi:hypothetical protein